MKKGIFLTNIPAPYRVDFFNELGKKCNLTVIYEREEATNRQWKKKRPIHYKETFLKSINIGDDMGFSFAILKYLKRDLDFIIIGGYSTPTGVLSILFCKLFRIGYFLNADGGLIKKDGTFKRGIKRFLIKGAKGYFSTGERCDEYLIYYGAKANRIHRYPFTSILKKDILVKPLNTTEKIELKEELGLEYETLFLYIGQFIHRKGIDLLLNSVDIHDNSKGYVLIGGTVSEEYLRIIKERNLKNVHFKKFMDRNELKKYYKASDVFVLPTREDIWGLVVNEALSYGLPVITTRSCVAGLELINEGENGYLYEYDDLETLKELLGKKYNRHTLNQLSLNSLKRIENYSIENMAEAIYLVIKGEE